jgi:hypothetical protein
MALVKWGPGSNPFVLALSGPIVQVIVHGVRGMLRGLKKADVKHSGVFLLWRHALESCVEPSAPQKVHLLGPVDIPGLASERNQNPN